MTPAHRMNERTNTMRSASRGSVLLVALAIGASTAPVAAQLPLRTRGNTLLRWNGPTQDLGPAVRSRLPTTLPERPWTAPFQLDGPLADLTLKGSLEAAKQRLQVQARLQAFAPFPVAQLQARAQDLDLAALLPGTEGVPRTGLTGLVTMTPNADRSLSVKADLDNGAAGRLDQYRLPLLSLALFPLYALAIPPIGWVAATSVYLIAMQLVLHPRRGLRLATLVVGSVAFSWLLAFAFESYLHVVLPRAGLL